MANRYAQPIKVPELKQKLWLLYLSSTGVESDSALGRLFRSEEEPDGITGKAIRDWINGDDARERNMVPAKRFARLVEIFRGKLAGHRTEAETRALLTSQTTADLQSAFFAGAPDVDWITLVLCARPGGATLVTRGRRGTLGVTARRSAMEEIAERIELPVGYWFQIKINEPGTGWLTIIQWGPSGWFGLELADGVASVERVGGEILLPPNPPYFFEREPDLRRYVLITTYAPLPPDLLSTFLTSARALAPLDATTLDRLAHIASHGQGFRMSCLDVRFVRPGELND